jgi:flagellar assembly factor FliW
MQMTSTNKVDIGKLFFEDGLPGFSHLQFYRLQQEEAETPFYLLQSEEDEQVGFWVVDPFSFFPDYQFTLNSQVKRALHVGEDTPVVTMNIVTLRPEGQVTVNLKAPIIINPEKRMAKQVILNEEIYQVRQPLFQMKPAVGK